ncbi:MAG: LamG domain-containing protein, partial [Planctomycetota bacterium]|nr:LamG domain-containing protein [Planctomycetota bacterium]
MLLSTCSANTRSRGIHWGCVLLLLLSPTLVSAQSPLVLHLPFEDAVSPIDVSDNPTTVVAHGSLNSTDGQFGTKALEFDGDNANRIEVTSAPKLEGMSALTVEAWVLPRNLAGQEGMCIVSKRVAWGDSDVYNLFVWQERQVEARVNGAGALRTTTSLEDDTWYHIAYVFDGQGTSGEKMKIYINGVLEISGDHPDSNVNETGAPVWVGELDADRGFAWNGIIDEVGIWNIPLSQDQINRLMVQPDKTEVLNFASGAIPEDDAVLEATWINLA